MHCLTDGGLGALLYQSFDQVVAGEDANHVIPFDDREVLLSAGEEFGHSDVQRVMGGEGSEAGNHGFLDFRALHKVGDPDGLGLGFGAEENKNCDQQQQWAQVKPEKGEAHGDHLTDAGGNSSGKGIIEFPGQQSA